MLLVGCAIFWGLCLVVGVAVGLALPEAAVRFLR
jgi:hypothetical protein